MNGQINTLNTLGKAMFDIITTKIGAFFTMLPFTGATWFVLATLGFFIWLFARASKNPRSMVNWEDLIVDSNNNRASPYKVGYLIGVIVATWLIVTINDTQTLTFDMLGMYLTFLATGAGINTFSKAKSSGDTTITSSTVIQAPAPGPNTSILSVPSAPQPATPPSVTVTTTTAPAPVAAPPIAPAPQIVPIVLGKDEPLPRA